MSGYGSRWKYVRAEALERDGFRCQIRDRGCTGRATHVDHIVPVSEGGALLDVDNCRASCRSCNIRRGNARRAELADAAIRMTQGRAPSARVEW